MIITETQTDCLASKNIFYNKKTNKISDNINELLESSNIEFDAEGLKNYLDYGFCVFGHTPIKNIYVLQPNSHIWIDETEKIKIEKLDDPFEKLIGRRTNVEETLELIHEKINMWVKESDTPIVIPTSGGFDSRLLNVMVDDKRIIHAYTYGISEKQEESFETVYAKKLCEILGIEWKQIVLGDFNLLMDKWYDIFGISTHAHGMYQMEFYHKIRKKEDDSKKVLSGVYGDLWAGNWCFPEIVHSKELIQLGITHGVTAHSEYCKLKGSTEYRDAFFELNREKLKDRNWRLVIAARIKMILISYLLRVPEYYGFEAWSPFIDLEVIAHMLNLDKSVKEGRKWQVEYFRKKNILIGELNLKCDKANHLDEVALYRHPPKLLNTKLLGTLMDENYVKRINDNLTAMTPEKLKYYYAYVTLYPIEKILQLKEFGKM